MEGPGGVPGAMYGAAWLRGQPAVHCHGRASQKPANPWTRGLGLVEGIFRSREEREAAVVLAVAPSRRLSLGSKQPCKGGGQPPTRRR